MYFILKFILFSVFKVTGINSEDGNAARRTCHCEAEAGQAQHPEPSLARWAALLGAAPRAVVQSVCALHSGSVDLHSDALEVIPELTREKKGCLRVGNSSLLSSGPLSQNGSFGPSPVSGGECSPPPTADPPARPLSATLNRRDMPRGEFGEHSHFTL